MQSDSRVDILPLRLNDYEKIVFFTGAGMSEESGIPTYRGKGGTWKQYNYKIDQTIPVPDVIRQRCRPFE